MADPLSLQPWQWGILAVTYVLFFLLPAVWMWRKAARDGDNPLIWSALVAVGSIMGIYEYYHHRGIQKARARRVAAKAKKAEADADAGEAREAEER